VLATWLDWSALGRALRRVPRHLGITTAKLQHNLLATEVHLHTMATRKLTIAVFAVIIYLKTSITTCQDDTTIDNTQQSMDLEY
jgi:hypothetical protein